MNAYTYILFSKALNRFYIGSTELTPGQRLELHLSKNYGTAKYTAKADDWILYGSVVCNNISTARKVERYIKRMKSRKFIESLKDNPDKWNWIIHRI